MAIVKWVLMGIGGLTVLVLAGCLGAVGYLASAPPQQLTAADLKPGSPSLPGEREAFVQACSSALKNMQACVCMADEAEISWSRFQRLAMTALYAGDMRRAFGYAKGLAGARIEPMREEDFDIVRFQGSNQALQRCMAGAKTAQR